MEKRYRMRGGGVAKISKISVTGFEGTVEGELNKLGNAQLDTPFSLTLECAWCPMGNHHKFSGFDLMEQLKDEEVR